MLFEISNNYLFLNITSYILIVSSILFHFILPRLMSRYPFNIWSEPFFHNTEKLRKYLKVIKFIEYRILLPIILGSIFRINEGKNFGFSQFVESMLTIMMTTYVTTMAYRHIARFGLVLALSLMNEMHFDFPLFHLYFYLIAIWLLDEMLEKLNYVNTYSSLHSMTSLAQLFCLVMMIANIQFVLMKC